MEVTVTQEGGLTLSIAPCPRQGNGVIIAQLTGTKFLAEVAVGNEPSSEEAGPLAAFLEKAASFKAGQAANWLSLCQDLGFTVTVEPEFSGRILLRVYMGSNSNDECDWQVNASLLLRPEQLRRFASAVPVPHH